MIAFTDWAVTSYPIPIVTRTMLDLDVQNGGCALHFVPKSGDGWLVVEGFATHGADLKQRLVVAQANWLDTPNVRPCYDFTALKYKFPDLQSPKPINSVWRARQGIGITVVFGHTACGWDEIYTGAPPNNRFQYSGNVKDISRAEEEFWRFAYEDTGHGNRDSEISVRPVDLAGGFHKPDGVVQYAPDLAGCKGNPNYEPEMV